MLILGLSLSSVSHSYAGLCPEECGYKGSLGGSRGSPQAQAGGTKSKGCPLLFQVARFTLSSRDSPSRPRLALLPSSPQSPLVH